MVVLNLQTEYRITDECIGEYYTVKISYRNGFIAGSARGAVPALNPDIKQITHTRQLSCCTSYDMFGSAEKKRKRADKRLQALVSSLKGKGFSVKFIGPERSFRR